MVSSVIADEAALLRVLEGGCLLRATEQVDRVFAIENGRNCWTGNGFGSTASLPDRRPFWLDRAKLETVDCRPLDNWWLLNDLDEQTLSRVS